MVLLSFMSFHVKLSNKSPQPRIGHGSSAVADDAFWSRVPALWTLGVMWSLSAITLLLIFVGCATQRDTPPYVYTPPVVVSLASLCSTNGYSLAIFTFSNVSSAPMWYDGEGRESPACCMEYKSMPLAEHSPGFYWGDTGLGRYKLSPGESGTFRVTRKQFSGPFRAGVWLCEEWDNRTANDSIYWSPYVTP